MLRSILLGTLVLLAHPVLAQPFEAEVTTEAGVHQSALLDSPSLGTLPAASTVMVRDCLQTACLVEWPDALPYGPWVSAEALSVAGTPAYDHARQLAQARMQRVAITIGGIRLEGDSYMGGACGTAIAPMIAASSNRPVRNTAIGGSTMDESRDRILAPENRNLLPYVTVFWDGSQNGFTTATEYADLLAESIAALGHERFVVIPAATPAGQTNAEQVPQIIAEFQARWPDNMLDWRDTLPTDEYGALDPSLMCDNVHLNTDALGRMAEAVTAFVRGKGW